MAWQTFDTVKLTALNPSQLVATDENRILTTNASTLSPSFTAVTLGTGAGGAAAGLIAQSAGGVALRIFGAATGTPHQWDAFQSGDNFRVTDNTGGGTFEIDSKLQIHTLPSAYQTDTYLTVDALGNVHKSRIGPQV